MFDQWLTEKMDTHQPSLTQAQLAAAVRVSQQLVSDWKSGKKHPGTQYVQALAMALGCPVDEVLREIVRSKEEGLGFEPRGPDAI